MSSADDAEIARDVQCTECGTLYDRPHGYRTRCYLCPKCREAFGVAFDAWGYWQKYADGDDRP